MNGPRAYRLEDLDAYVESLPGWYDSTGERSAKVVGDRRVYVPLSDYALELLGKGPRTDKCPFVFVWPDTKRPVRDSRHSFFEGRAKAGLEWVGFHDLRHFRATQWIMRGADIRSVQGMLGHRNIKTTERYVKFVPSHASQRVIEAQRLEDQEMAMFHRRPIGDIEGSKSSVFVSS